MYPALSDMTKSNRGLSKACFIAPCRVSLLKVTRLLASRLLFYIHVYEMCGFEICRCVESIVYVTCTTWFHSLRQWTPSTVRSQWSWWCQLAVTMSFISQRGLRYPISVVETSGVHITFLKTNKSRAFGDSAMSVFWVPAVTLHWVRVKCACPHRAVNSFVL